MLADRHRGIQNPQTPKPVEQAEPAARAQLGQQAVEPEGGEHRKGHMQGRAGIARGIGGLEKLQAGMPRPVDIRARHGRGPDREDPQPGQTQAQCRQAKRHELPAHDEQRRRQGNIQPQRQIERQRPGPESDPPVHRRERHQRDRAERMIEHPKIKPEEPGHPEGRAQHLRRPPLARADPGLANPSHRWRGRRVHARIRAGQTTRPGLDIASSRLSPRATSSRVCRRRSDCRPAPGPRQRWRSRRCGACRPRCRPSRAASPDRSGCRPARSGR